MASRGDAKPTLGELFESRPNGLNFLRLCMAIEVIVWHSYGLRGSTWLPTEVEAFLSDIAVDSFFAISGFLIVRAWCRRPRLGAFLAARAKRILPGLWVCLMVTAFLVAPVAAWASGTAQPSAVGQWHYVLSNADTWVSSWGIDGGPVGVPREGAWNGSLWSLGYEAVCYLVVAGLGVARLLRPLPVASIAVSMWVLSGALVVAGFEASGMPIWCTPRCGLMFSAGAVMWMFRDRIPVTLPLAVAASAMVTVGFFTPNYRLSAAPGIAYLCLVSGLALGRWARLVLRNDLSYGVYVYGYVIQQALLLIGVRVGWAPFAVLSITCVFPVATASWFLVERPALRLRLKPRLSQQLLAGTGLSARRGRRHSLLAAQGLPRWFEARTLRWPRVNRGHS